MVKWEYKRDTFYNECHHREGLIDWLNKRGDDGWEAVNESELLRASVDSQTYLFKRPIAEPEVSP